MKKNILNQTPSKEERELMVTAMLHEREEIYRRLFEMSKVYETMDTGSALKALLLERVLNK
jgi:hypothetical protein